MCLEPQQVSISQPPPPAGVQILVPKHRSLSICSLYARAITTEGNQHDDQEAAAKAMKERLRHFIAGTFAGGAGVFVGHPFDTIKVCG